MNVGHYRLLTQIGAGRDGVSYRAQAHDGESLCEVHHLSSARADPERFSRLISRARLAARLQHPAATRVVELSVDQDPPFVALEWTGERSLAELIGHGKVFLEAEALGLVGSLAGALSEAHRLGLVHGRLDPHHVRLDESLRPKLEFIGAEVHTDAQDDQARTLEASCRTPETRAGKTPDRPADVYGLGMLLVCLLKSPGHLVATQAEGSIASSLSALVQELTAADPDDRPLAPQAEARLAALTAPAQDTGEWKADDPRMAVLQSPSQAHTLLLSNQPVTLSPTARPEMLGRFRLLELLGEGGQGAVYRAQDTADDSIVALKILRTERAGRPEVLRRFRKEARLLAEANNPYVVNLLEFNDEDSIPYLVLEFVAGKNVEDLIRGQTRLDEPAALQIMAGVARALEGPHERGIIHRDVKPANILLLDPRPMDGTSLAQTIEMPDAHPLEGPPTIEEAGARASFRVKLSDFGLARHVVDTQSLAMTAAGSLLGTPHYMAPEQWTGLATDPRTDVYAMGATLFQMLAGRPPFAAQTRDELLAQHCNEPVPSLRQFNPAVSEGVVRVVEKALAKAPQDRYVDAGAILRDLDALLHGTPTEIVVHPRLPAFSPADLIAFDWTWDLEASPRQLWPHVSNTERVNRALGLPAPEFTTRVDTAGGVERYAAFRKVVPFSWREHPFEWVEGQRFGVLREFQQGVFAWFMSLVELQPKSGGGTRLVQHIRLVPRGLGGRLMAHLQLARGGRRSLENVYRRIDAVVSGNLGPRETSDPFEAPVKLLGAKRARLEQGLDELAARGIDLVIVERLGRFLEQAPDPEVARIRPLALAQRWGIDADSLVAACLHGAREGLLVLLWDLLCPICRISSEIKDTLRAIRDHGHCPACNLDYPLDFASSVELVFRVHPEIRKVDLGTYCIGGPAHFPHVLAQVRIAAGERIELALELPEGSYRLRGPQLPWSVDFQVQPGAATRLWEIDLTAGPAADHTRRLRAGHQVLTFFNELERELVVRIERTALRIDALTASRAGSLALFRELFPGEVLSPGQLATVSTVTLLIAELDPAQADTLYRDLDDSRAFNVMQELFHVLGEAIRASGGAVVKTVGDGSLAAFPDPAMAVRLGLELQEHLSSGDLTRNLRLRVAIHRGTALAANINDHLDYFGTTARHVMKLTAHVSAGELALSPAVASDPEVAAFFASRGIEPEVMDVEQSGLGFLMRIQPGK